MGALQFKKLLVVIRILIHCYLMKRMKITSSNNILHFSVITHKQNKLYLQLLGIEISRINAICGGTAEILRCEIRSKQRSQPPFNQYIMEYKTRHNDFRSKIGRNANLISQNHKSLFENPKALFNYNPLVFSNIIKIVMRLGWKISIKRYSDI